MEQRISVVTLGVADVAKARSFYEALGWTGAQQPDDDIAFFQAGGLVVSLWDRRQLVAEVGLDDGGGFGAVCLAHNVRSVEEVESVLDQARRSGGKVTAPAKQQPWGGVSGIFTDPDGHAWEVAYNPYWALNEDGTVTLQ